MFDPTLAAGSAQRLALQTRKGGLIENDMDPNEMPDGVAIRIQALKDRYPNAKHRNVGPSAMYNCHGLTFAARRTGVSKPAQIQRILNDDGYIKLDALTQKPEAGDIAIYRENGDITHSGIVVGTKGDTPWILGKWGDCHEVVHAPMDCPYKDGQLSYYRLLK